MATLEKSSRRKIKKEKKPKIGGICENEGELRKAFENDSKNEASSASVVSDTTTSNIVTTLNISKPENYRLKDLSELSGGSISASNEPNSPKELKCEFDAGADCNTINPSDSGFGEATSSNTEKEVDSEINDRYHVSSIPRELDIAKENSLAPKISRNVSGTRSEPEDKIGLESIVSTPCKIESSSDSCGLQSSSSEVVEATKDSTSDVREATMNTKTRVVCATHDVISQLSISERTLTKRFSHEEEQKFEGIRAVQSDLVPTVPSAPPCDIPWQEDTLERMHCLEESSLCALYPLTEIHVVFPSESVIRVHPLYVLISDYLRACNHLERSLKRHDSMVAEYEQLKKTVWSIKREDEVKLGKCGDDVIVSATYRREVAVKDKTQLSLLAGSLSAAREALHSECALHLFDSEAQRLRVEYFVQAEEDAQAVIPAPEELRACVMILFLFIQQQDLNLNFISKVKSWVLRLGQGLLKLGSSGDHLFLLSHLLHCPKGVSGWGTPLIQLDPPPPRSGVQSAKKCPELELVMAALSTLLEAVQMPVPLPQLDVQQNKESSDEAWVVLDSSGEEECLHLPSDDDLEIFLDRIPLKALVLHALGLLKEDDSLSLSGVDVLRLFSLSNSTLKILGCGLQNYGSRRYPHFFKRIAALVHHIANLITDVLHIFKSSKHFEWDPAMKLRITVEYEALIIRASGYLFHSVIHSAGWETLSQMPYKDLSIHACWHLLAVFHRSRRVDCSGDVVIPCGGTEGWATEIKESCSLFDDCLFAESEEEASMLLTTMKNIALSNEDITFAEAVAFDIFRVGHQTRETSGLDLSKVADSLLASIFSKHPCLFSLLIGWLNESPQEVDKGMLHLFDALPLHLWQPSKANMKILSSWVLCHDPVSTWSTMSQTILLALPWRGISGGEGPLPLDINLSAAALALDACLKWDSKGRIPSAIRFESAISTWAWSLVSVLCIHPLDRKYCQALQLTSAANDNPVHEVVHRGLQEAHPLASLVAVLATDWGHNWNNAQKHAFSQLSNVVAYGKNTAAISALYLILPLFVGYIDVLISCQSFQKLFLSLLFADRTYVKMAKSFIHYEFPGPILSQLGSMVVTLLEHPYRFDSSIDIFVKIWLRSILEVPNWKSEQEALFLADIVLRSAFLEQSGKTWEEALLILRGVQELNMLHIPPSPGTFSTLMNLLARGPAPGSPRPLSLMTQSSFSNFPWFVLATLEVEEVHESILWDQLQVELRATANNSGKLPLDAAIKSACQSSGLLPFPAAYLCIYRWARQALDTPLGHPVLLLIWARFFSIYIRIFSISSQNSSMPFEGPSFSTLLNQLKKKLNESAEWYSKEASVDGVSHDTSQWLRYCSRLFQSFDRLLEGEQQSSLSSNFSLDYSPARVAAGILHKNRTLWQKNFIDIPQSKSDIKSSILVWDSLIKNCREKMINLDSHQFQHLSHPLQRIHDRLKSCKDPYPIPFPTRPKLSVKLKHVQIICGKEATSKAITSCLSPLLECARWYSLHESQHTAFDCASVELYNTLYQDVWVKFTCKVKCDPKVSDSGETQVCSSPASIHFKVKESKLCREVGCNLENVFACRKRLIASVLRSAPLEACSAGVVLENMVRMLVSEKNNKSDGLKIQESALFTLNLLLDLLSEEVVSQYLPAKKLLTSCIETLVHEFVLGKEHNFLLLLTQMLQNRILTEILSPLLTPSDLSTSALLQAYSILVKHLPSMDNNLAFVLLSKFEVNNWLHLQPAKQERCTFVKLVIDGLACCCSVSSESEWSLVLGLLQRHLKLLLIHNFPEILVDALDLILRATGEHTLQPFIWNDVLDTIISLGCPNQPLSPAVAIIKADTSPEVWSKLTKEFSVTQTALSSIQVKDVMALMAAFFRRERLHFGLHGLYPKYRMHLKPIRMLLELLGCSILALRHRGKREVPHAAGAFDQTWLALQDMYAPWLLPYWEEELTGSECTLWILELMNGDPPLAPWIPSDTPFAKNIAASYSCCLHFMFEITPGRHNSLGLIWDMYCSSFSRPGVGSHILETIHDSLLLLPWDQFWPTVQNLKDMADIAESSPMECRIFLCTILPCVAWREWMDSLVSSAPLSAQALSCFLKVLILISGTAGARKVDDSGLLPLLETAKNLSWHNLNATDYTALLDLFISRANPMVVLSWNIPGNDGEEDRALLELFKTIAGLHESSSMNVLPQRCLPFLHAIVKQLAKVIEGGQYGSSPTQSTADVALLCLLQELERVVDKGYPEKEDQEKVNKMADAVKQVLIPVLPNVSLKFISCLSQSIATKSMPPSSCQPAVLCAKGLIQALQNIRLPYMQLGLLIESAIETALLDKRNTCSPLDNVHKLLINEGDCRLVIADGLSSAGYLLTLLAYLHSTSAEDDLNSEKNNSARELLHQLIHRWLPAITISDDLEAKIPLLWSYAIVLAHKLERRSSGESNIGSSEDLSVLASSLVVLGDGHEGMVSSLLGAVGLKRKASPSKRFRVMCLTFAAFVFACLAKDGIPESHLKEALAGVANLCHRYKELRDVVIIATSATSKSTDLSFVKGSELLAKLLGRLYPEKPGYLQCIT